MQRSQVQRVATFSLNYEAFYPNYRSDPINGQAIRSSKVVNPNVLLALLSTLSHLCRNPTVVPLLYSTVQHRTEAVSTFVFSWIPAPEPGFEHNWLI